MKLNMSSSAARLHLSQIAIARYKLDPTSHPNVKCAGKKSYFQHLLFSELSKHITGLTEEVKHDGYWMDIALESAKLNIEYDGLFWHAKRTNEDQARDLALQAAGWKVLRITSDELKRGKPIAPVIAKVLSFCS